MNELAKLRLEQWVARARLLPALRRLRAAVSSRSPALRQRAQEHQSRFEAFRARYAPVFAPVPRGRPGSRGLALFMVNGFPPCVALEIGLIKGLQLAGYEVAVLHFGGDSVFVLPYYALAGVKRVFAWKDYAPAPDVGAAKELLARCSTLEDLFRLEERGVRIGQFAVSTHLRRFRKGSVSLADEADRRALIADLAIARRALAAAEAIRREIDPALGVFVDTEYSPRAELFDHFLTCGVGVLQYDIAHKSNALMLHRYDFANRNQHPWSLSDASWELVRNMEWSDHHRQLIAREIEGAYRSGDWFSACGTQFGTRMEEASALRQRLGLDPAKKTATIFSHIVWDAPVVWGTRLFPFYEDWLIETVRAAIANPRLNWLLKIHPANRGKAAKEGFEGEPTETIIIRERIGSLPEHVRLIPADTPISTHSLLAVTDYCITVRGTVGIEAARLGIPVVNAGGGRYDRRGFTMDPESREEYLDILGRLDQVPPLTAAQRELADRFAYGYFTLRPFVFSSVKFWFKRGSDAASGRTIDGGSEILVRNATEWEHAPDLRDFADWLTSSPRPDYLNLAPFGEAAALSSEPGPTRLARAASPGISSS